MAGALQRKKRKKRIYKKHRGKCYLCKKQISKRAATLDHIVPRSRGGGSTKSNLAIACAACNQAKGSMALTDYLTKTWEDKDAP